MQLEIERRTIRRIMWRLIPFMGLCYMINWLDRTNIGFAALTMNKALGISATVYGAAAGIFFLGYVICEVPSNLALAKVGGRIWIARILITWGLLAAGMALVSGERSLYVARFLLGAAEGGFYPGVIYYFRQWVPSQYRARMYGWFGACGASALILSGPIAGYILQLDGVLGVAGWQWLFVIEGVPATILGLVCLRYLQDSPSQANWLAPEERKWLTDTLDRERNTLAAGEHISIWRAVLDWRILVLSGAYFFFGFGLYGVALWMPQIIREFGFTTVQIGYLTALPPICGTLWMIFWTWHSDYKNERQWHLVLTGLIGTSGLLLVAWQSSNIVLVMIGFCLTSIGAFTTFPIILTWPTAALSGVAAAAATAVINCIGTSNGYFGAQLIGVLKDLTGDFRIAMLLTACGLFIAPLLIFIFGSFLNIKSRDEHSVTAVVKPIDAR